MEDTLRKNLNVDYGVFDDVETLSTKWSRGQNPTLKFEVKYYQCRPMWISFKVMKIDYPKATAIYIVSKKTRGQRHKDPLRWAEQHMRSLRRVHASSLATYGESRPTTYWGETPSESVQNKFKWVFFDNLTSQIRRFSKKRKKNVGQYPKLKYGVSVPKDTSEAYRLDIKSGNSLWSEAFNKEL